VFLLDSDDHGGTKFVSKMQNLEFPDIATVLNYSRTTHIDLTPIKSKQGRWSLYRGTHTIHASSYPFNVLYFYAAATVDDLRIASRELDANIDTHVVYPSSREQKIQRSTEVASFFKKVKGFWTAKEYLVSFIKDEIQAYLKKIAEQRPGDYIDPGVQTPSGFPRKIPNPLLSFLTDPEMEADVGKLGILLAEPGQGKTYMSRYLVARLPNVDKTLVPLMVDSSQWQTMSVEDQRSLSKTIAHSFRHFGATIGWLDGHEDGFLRATLKADVFRVVFDGFDEYILRNQGAVQPLEVLEALAELARVTGTRIIITSRTSFWNTNLPDKEIQDFLTRTGSFVFTILPFDLNNAHNYFRRRLTDEVKIKRANQVYELLQSNSEALAGRGFVLSLVADLADQGGDATGFSTQGSQVMHWLIEALCQREALRQQLPFTGKEQVDILRTFAVEVAEGGTPNTELLELSMGVVRPTLDLASRQGAIEKLKSHPLFEKDISRDLWDFKQEQVRILLLAEELVTWKKAKTARFVNKARLDAGTWQDLGTTIVELNAGSLGEDKALKQLEQIVAILSSPRESNGSPQTNAGSRLAGIIALNTVERFFRKGSSHKDRAQALVRLCGGECVRYLTLSGTVDRYDFSGIRFEQCRFERVLWANCEFDSTTIFHKCDFIGGVSPARCTGLGNVDLQDCGQDPEVEAIFNNERVKEGRKKYSSDDLRADIHSVISKFIIKGGIGLKSIESRNLAKGSISASRHRDVILEVLTSLVLESHQISGAGDGYNVRKEALEAIRFYAANNVFTGPLRAAFEKLQKQLGVS
jgi:hypothetical protein